MFGNGIGESLLPRIGRGTSGQPSARRKKGHGRPAVGFYRLRQPCGSPGPGAMWPYAVTRFRHRRQPARVEAAEGEQGEGGGARGRWGGGGGGAASPNSRLSTHGIGHVSRGGKRDNRDTLAVSRDHAKENPEPLGRRLRENIEVPPPGSWTTWQWSR